MTDNKSETFKKKKCVFRLQRIKTTEWKNETTNMSVFFHERILLFMKGVCVIRSIILLEINFQDINADFVSISIPRMHFFTLQKGCY